MDKHIQQQKQKQQEIGFTIISLDESFFFYDSLVRRVWIEEKKRPVGRVTGSHKHSCICGAISMDGNKHKQQQLFIQYDRFNGDTFPSFLKIIHFKFPRCYLFLDKASPHYRSKKVREYFERNKDALIPLYLPTASPGFMVMEKVWNTTKRDLFVLRYYTSFADFKEKISAYLRTKRFNLDMRNYLLRDVI